MTYFLISNVITIVIIRHNGFKGGGAYSTADRLLVTCIQGILLTDFLYKLEMYS